jgi:hypothetical protein
MWLLMEVAGSSKTAVYQLHGTTSQKVIITVFIDTFLFILYLAVGEISSIQGVFKKRQNFLNSAPTSKEGAMRLLSAPSGRF